MSYKKGYNYDNVKEFCEKYGCKLLTTPEEMDSESKEFNIESSCGHNITTTFSKMFKRKIGVYCVDCFNDMNEAKCFSCNEMFEHTENSFVYCSSKCTHSHKVTDEHKQKVKETHRKKLGYYDKNGDVMNDNDIKQLRLKRKETERRKANIEEKKLFTYKFIKKEYENEGCELLTSEEDFNNDKICKKVKIKGKCGCIIECPDFRNFIYRKTKINCDICTNNNTSNNMKERGKINGVPTTMIIENNGVELIKKKCINQFIIIKTRECCEADILVKPINEERDLWLPIQLKVTSKQCIRPGIKRYIFRIHRQYTNMLLLLVSNEDEKFWLFESNCEKIKSLNKISIGDKTTRYDTEFVNNIIDNFNYWYNKNIYNITFENGNTPQSKTAQLEYAYVKLRESNIDFLNFADNQMDGLVYDFKIDNLKIQEKVCTPHNKSNFASIHKNGGRRFNGEKNVQTKIPYCERDNDFYWFHIQDKNTFYVIPEIELVDRDFITSKIGKGKKHIYIGPNGHWMKNYKFHYDTINEEENKEELMLILGLI